MGVRNYLSLSFLSSREERNHDFLATHKQTWEDCARTNLQTSLLITSSAHRMNGHNYLMMCVIHSSTNSRFSTCFNTHKSVGHLTDYTQGCSPKELNTLRYCNGCPSIPRYMFQLLSKHVFFYGPEGDSHIHRYKTTQPASKTNSFLSVCFISTPKQNRFLGLNQRDKVVWVFVGITFDFFQPVSFFPSSVTVH